MTRQSRKVGEDLFDNKTTKPLPFGLIGAKKGAGKERINDITASQVAAWMAIPNSNQLLAVHSDERRFGSLLDYQLRRKNSNWGLEKETQSFKFDLKDFLEVCFDPHYDELLGGLDPELNMVGTFILKRDDDPRLEVHAYLEWVYGCKLLVHHFPHYFDFSLDDPHTNRDHVVRCWNVRIQDFFLLLGTSTFAWTFPPDGSTIVLLQRFMNLLPHVQ